MRAHQIAAIAAGLILTMSGAGLVSCAASTDPAGFGQMAQSEVKRGMTKAQVREILGSPHAITSDNGRETWIYQRNNSLRALVPLGLAGSETNFVSVRFGSSGTVLGVDNRGAINTGAIGH